MKDLEDIIAPSFLERPNQVVMLINKETNPFKVRHQYPTKVNVDEDLMIDHTYINTHDLTPELLDKYIVLEMKYSIHSIKAVPKSVLLNNKGDGNNVMYFPNVFKDIEHIDPRERFMIARGSFSEIIPRLVKRVINQSYLFPFQALEVNSKIHPESLSSVMILDVIEIGSSTSNLYRLDLHIREPKDYAYVTDKTLELPIRAYERSHEEHPVVDINPELMSHLSSADRDVVSLMVYSYGKGR